MCLELSQTRDGEAPRVVITLMSEGREEGILLTET
jgi:hypothetical protein